MSLQLNFQPIENTTVLFSK